MAEQAGPNWLERMHQFLTWKVVYPEPNQPFKPPMSDKVLGELSTDKNVLSKYVTLKGSMDGEEIMRVENLVAFSLHTDNPEISRIPKPLIKQYLESSGVMTQVQKDLENIQNIYKDEISRRRSESAQRA